MRQISVDDVSIWRFYLVWCLNVLAQGIHRLNFERNVQLEYHLPKYTQNKVNLAIYISSLGMKMLSLVKIDELCVEKNKNKYLYDIFKNNSLKFSKCPKLLSKKASKNT